MSTTENTTALIVTDAITRSSHNLIATWGGKTGKKIHLASPGSSCLGCGHWTRHNVKHFEVTAYEMRHATPDQLCSKCFPIHPDAQEAVMPTTPEQTVDAFIDTLTESTPDAQEAVTMTSTTPGTAARAKADGVTIAADPKPSTKPRASRAQAAKDLAALAADAAPAPADMTDDAIEAEVTAGKGKRNARLTELRAERDRRAAKAKTPTKDAVKAAVKAKATTDAAATAEARSKVTASNEARAARIAAKKAEQNDRVKQVLELRKQGLTFREIAVKVGLQTPQAVSSIIGRYGSEMRGMAGGQATPLTAEQVTELREVEKRMGRSLASLARALNRAG